MDKSVCEPLNADLNSNTGILKTDEFFLHDLLDVALKGGRFFFGISYSICPSRICSSEFIVKNHRKQQMFLKFLHVAFFMFLVVPFITEKIYLSPCCLVNLIKKGLHIVLTISMLVGYYNLEVRGRSTEEGFVKIFQQCVVLQKKFGSAGLHFPSRYKMRRFGWIVFIVAVITCIMRQYIFCKKRDPWYSLYGNFFSTTFTLGFWKPDNITTPETVSIIVGLCGIVFDGILAMYWFFCQIFILFSVLTMWMIFDKLNKAWRSGYLEKKNLPMVVELHFQSIKLLNLMNQLISPLTFWIIVFNITCMCFWTNYIAVDFKIKTHYIAAFCFFVKTLVEMGLQADVNTKAHQISEWLEESCTTEEQFPTIDPVKFVIFTSQVYSRDCTGFKGLNYFVVTPHLAIAVVGIVVTYTVAVNQLCH